MLKHFNVTIEAAPSPPEQVQPLGIRDVARFKALDRLLLAGWGNVSQDKIPEEILAAAEAGAAILERGPDRDSPFATPVSERPKKPPRKMTPEKIERRRFLAKQRYEYRFPGHGPRPGARKQTKGKE